MTESLRFRVREATLADVSSIRRFDARMLAAGRKERISYSRALLGQTPDSPVAPGVSYRLLIAESDEEIRAAVVLLNQEFFVDGQRHSFSYVQMPVSEGIYNRAYALAIVQLIKDATRMYPNLISLGVGSRDEVWARFVMSLGWKARTIPFLFYPVKPQEILRRLGYLDQRPRLRLAARVAAATGLPSILGSGLTLYRRASKNRQRYRCEVVQDFGAWADDVFREALPDYSATAGRGAEALNLIYPPDRKGINRLRVKCRTTDRDLGWVVTTMRKFSGGGYFGDLNVGVLADGFGAAADVPALVQCATDDLAERNAEIVVTNWSHKDWLQQCRRYGFVAGPSNYHAFLSPKASALVPAAPELGQVHLTRGDSDGLNVFQVRQPAIEEKAAAASR